MTRGAFYNENDPFRRERLLGLMQRGLIEEGKVDGRSIADLAPADVAGFGRAHFFAGAFGGWDLALKLAGWPEGAKVWTGSPPCGPWSEVGRRLGAADPRDLWPVWFGLIRQCRPTPVFAEITPEAIPLGWFDRAADDLEGEGYAVWPLVFPASAVGAPHIRERLYLVADADRQPLVWPPVAWPQRHPWPAEPDLARVAHGIPDQRHYAAALGDAIVPQQAAAFVTAFLEAKATAPHDPSST
jgi:site-specific DNA-cytosine methylase